MEQKKEMLDEGLDLRFFLLRFMNVIWIVFVAALAGAAICAGGYLLYKQIFPAAKEYQAQTKYYIDFAEDSTGIGYGYYNDYTWNDFMKSDDILQYTLSLLPDHIDQKTVEQAVEADIISDVRVLTITVTTASREITDQIAQATAKSLVHYPEAIKEIDGIRVIREDAAGEIIVGSLAKNWGIFGFVSGVSISLFVLWMVCCMDVSVYLPKDVEGRFGLPVAGVLYKQAGKKEKRKIGKQKSEEGIKTAGETTEREKKPENKESALEKRELWGNMEYLLRGKEKISVVTICEAGDITGLLESLEEIDCMKDKKITYEGRFGETDFGHMRSTDAGILCFSYGGGEGKLAGRYVSDLKKQGCKITCAIIYDADERMYRRYYWGKRNRHN